MTRTLTKGTDGYKEGSISCFKKYPVDSDVDPKVIFCFAYLSENKTTSYISNHGRVMFIIRGPPYTKKTKLSNMLIEKYPNAIYCSAIKYIDGIKLKNPTADFKETTNATHKICLKLVKDACLANKSTIIVQNSNMRYFEVKTWLDLAASYDYTVVMAITMYKFDITPEALIRHSGMNASYVTKRLEKWHDIQPMFTGWFVAPRDSEHMRYFTLKTLEALLEDREFCRLLKVHDNDDVKNYFKPRKVLSCVAGYTKDFVAMTKYYLSDTVQAVYGKTFTAVVVGYLVTKSDIIGIVHLSSDMKSLVLYDLDDTSTNNRGLIPEISANVSEHGKTTEFPEEENLPQNTTLVLEDWRVGEEINTSRSSFIHLAQKGFEVFDLRKIRKEFNDSLQIISDNNGIIHRDAFTELEDGETKACKLHDDAWLVKAPKKICIKTIFTGLYV